MLYVGDDTSDIFEFAGLFTGMDLALDEHPLASSMHNLKGFAVHAAHTFIILYALIFSAQRVRVYMRERL